jgi:hypothetical protein
MFESERTQIHKPINTSEYRDEQRGLSGAREYDGGPVRQYLDSTEKSKKKHESEVARLMRRDFAETGFQDRRQNPPAVAPRESSEYANLSSRQKKKLAARRAKNLKRARKEYGEGATEDTLPMAAQLREHRRKREGARGAEPTESPESALRGLQIDGGIFDSLYAGGADTSFDLRGAMAKNQEMKDILYRFDALADRIESLPPVTRARIGELRSMQACMERAIATMLAANGVNYSTGNHARPREIREAKAQKAAALADFRKMAEGRREAVMDSLERMSEEKVREKIEAQKKAHLEAPKDERLRDIPFAFANVPSPELMLKVRDGIDAKPERYAAHRDAIDRMFAEFMDVNRRLSEMSMRARAFADLRTEALEKGDGDAAEVYNDIRLRIIDDPAGRAAGGRMIALGAMIRYLTEDRKEDMEDWMHTALEDEYGIVTEERGRQKEAIASLDLMEEKNREFEAEKARLEAENARRLEADRKFKEEFPFCDEHSVAIADEIRLAIKRQGQSLDDTDDIRASSTVEADDRSVRVFCSGYDVGEDGEPLTEEDSERKKRDVKFISDYYSGDESLRRLHLDRIKDDMLNISLTPEMLTPEYMNGHAAELRVIGDRLVCFDSLLHGNEAYLYSLPQSEQNLINEMFNLGNAFSAYFGEALIVRGIAASGNSLYGAGDGLFVAEIRERLESSYERILDAIDAYEKKKHELRR